MPQVEEKLDMIISEIHGLKKVLEDQTHVLEDMVNLFTKYDQDLLLENDELREG